LQNQFQHKLIGLLNKQFSQKQEILSDLTQNEIKKIRSLRAKKGRLEYRQFLAEGARLLEEAVRYRRTPEKIYYCRDALSDRGSVLIDTFLARKVDCRMISSRNMGKITDTKNPQGILGIFGIWQLSVSDIVESRVMRLLYLDNLSDPGNAGTLMRSALAFGFDAVGRSENTVDLFNPKVIRGSAGAIFGLQSTEIPINDVCGGEITKDFLVAIADPDGEDIEKTLKKIDVSSRLILAVGSEAEGVSPELKKTADLKIRIDHKSTVESLNAAVAGSIIMRELYEIARKGENK
jgi:TrmH family RNA methyltransferase